MTTETQRNVVAADVEEVRKLIEEAPIGQYIGAEGAKLFAERAKGIINLDDGDYLFRAGETTDSFFIVRSGCLARIKERAPSQRPKIIHTLHQGDMVGELSFIDQTHHSLSVIALGTASVVQFTAEDIFPMLEEHPKLMFNFMRAIIKRVHHTVADISQQENALLEYIQSGGKGRAV